MGVWRSAKALVTGAPRGMGRSHVQRFADEGASIIAINICWQIESVPYPMSTEAGLADTAREVEARGSSFVTLLIDVRDHAALQRASTALPPSWAGSTWWLGTQGSWHRYVQGGPRSGVPGPDGRELRGVWSTIAVGRGHLIRSGRGGSIVVISSVAGVRPVGAGVGTPKRSTA